MGVLDTLIGTTTNVLAAVPIAGPIVAPIVQQAAGIVGVAPTGQVGGAVGAAGGSFLQTIGGIAQLPGQVLQDVVGSVIGGAGAVDVTGFGGGNGRFATRTIVETMDTVTGEIVKRKVMPGSPHIMNSEISAAKKVFRQARKLDARLPRKTVRESKAKQLTNAAMDKALRDTQSGDCCPPKC